MNLGFDLDKVFIDYPPLIPNWIVDRIYKERDNDELIYRIPGKLEQYIRKLSHLPFFRKPIKKNMAILLLLSQNKNDNLFLISSRFSFLKGQTERLAKKYKLTNVFKEMFFNFTDQQPHLFKDNVIKNNKIDKYIDDDLSLVRYLALHNPQTRFFWLNDRINKKMTKNLNAVTHIDAIAS